MSEEQNNTNNEKELDVIAFLKEDIAKYEAATGKKTKPEQTIVEMTAAEFVKKFHEDIRYCADVQWREDKEGDFAHKGIAACIGLQWTADEHENEIRVTDIYEAKRAMEDDPKDPLSKAIWRKPRVAKPNAEKKTKTAKKPKKTKAPKTPKVKLTSLGEMSYDDFEKLVEEKGEDGIFEMYADEIREHGEWIWREQDRGGPMYELDSCIRMAEQELMDGLWGPRSE
jgi:hypothetical protein